MRQIDCLANMMIRGWVSTADAAAAGIMCFHKRREEMEGEFGYWSVDERGRLGRGNYVLGINGKEYKLESRDRTVKTRWDRPAKIKEFRLTRVRG